MKWLPVWLVLFCACARGEPPDGKWTTFHHGDFSFDYPAAWTINSQTSPVQHYRAVYVSLNSFGLAGFQVRDGSFASSGLNHRLESGESTTLDQLPKGAVYLDVATWEGPPLPPSDRPPDTDDKKIATLLDPSKAMDEANKQLLWQRIEFQKKRRRWSIVVFQ